MSSTYVTIPALFIQTFVTTFPLTLIASLTSFLFRYTIFLPNTPSPDPSYSPVPSLVLPEPASPSFPLSLPAPVPVLPLPVPPLDPSTVDGFEVDVPVVDPLVEDEPPEAIPRCR